MAKLPDLFTTLDEPAPYVATVIVEPPATNWLHLPSLHARLLPLAIAAGHEQLHLSCNYQGEGPSGCTYEARASGGIRGGRQYIGWLEPSEGDTAAHFEQALRAKLEQAVLPTSLRAAS